VPTPTNVGPPRGARPTGDAWPHGGAPPGRSSVAGWVLRTVWPLASAGSRATGGNHAGRTPKWQKPRAESSSRGAHTASHPSSGPAGGGWVRVDGCPGERGGGKRIASQRRRPAQAGSAAHHGRRAQTRAPTSNLDNLAGAVTGAGRPTPANDSYLVDSASSHMLVSKIKPCMSEYKQLYSETANGSLYKLSFI
jgi:hypothetical protein